MPNTPTDTILLINTSSATARLIQSLTMSFDTVIRKISYNKLHTLLNSSSNLQFSLIVLQLPIGRSHQESFIKQVRKYLGNQVPLLLLLPDKLRNEIITYLRAGADDFVQLPLHETHFSISFLILLEMGQVICNQKERTAKISAASSSSDMWNKITNFVQEGLNFFTPKTLLGIQSGDAISYRWQYLKKIGSGGFGTVWLVKDYDSGKLAVAKLSHSSQMNIRVLRSAAILKRLVHHPNIAHLIEVIRDKSRFILIQEYVEGATLSELLQTPTTPLDRENYFLQLLSIVSYGHKHKILHRDIKPENIIIRNDGRVKLLDYGIARDLSWQSPGSSSEGSVNYMAPEQNRGEVCIASDVWALGIILYIFTTGKHPYFQHTDHHSSTSDQSQSITIIPPRTVIQDLNPDLEEVIMTCLSEDLEKRYNSAILLQTTIQEKFPQFGRGETFPP